MKTNFKIGNIEAQGIKLENVDIQVEYSVDEIVKGFDFLKGVLADIPQIIEKVQDSSFKDSLNSLAINRILKEDFNKTDKGPFDDLQLECLQIPRELIRILKFGA